MRSLLLFCFAIFLGLSAFAEQSSDALNALDDQGRKTGYWIISGAIKPTKGYTPEKVIEEGSFEANKKQGLWKRYYPNGKLLSEITYSSNIPNGPYKTYYKTGVMEEQGNWSFNKNIGSFKRFHPNGKTAQDFTFNEHGVRNGDQRYFHENGQIELEVSIIQGKEEGVMKRYYANGDLKETKEFNGGMMNDGSTRDYAMKKPKVGVEESPAVAVKKSTIVKNDKPNISVFNETGNNTLYNKDRQVSQTGYFRNGRLWNGRWLRYDRNGLLEAIEIYKLGKFIGHAPLPEGQ